MEWGVLTQVSGIVPPIFRCGEEVVVIYSHSNPVIGNLFGLWVAETGPPRGGKGPGV
jgi:hypothetical protein